MPGLGKSVLAISAVRDQNLMKDCFGNHVYFINAGEPNINVANTLYRLGKILDDQFHKEAHKLTDFQAQEIDLMKDELTKIFLKPEFKDALLILNDVQSKDVIDAFRFGCKTLVTTRNRSIVPNECSETIDVSWSNYAHYPQRLNSFLFSQLRNGFNENESLALFSKCAEIEVQSLPKEAKQIHSLCRGFPLIIALIASQMEHFKEDAADVNRWKHYLKIIIDKKDG